MIVRKDQMAIDDDTRIHSDLSKAAAYNLLILYSTSNLAELARGVAETWLTA